MNKKIFIGLFSFFSIFIFIDVAAQCETWIGKPNQNDAENAHTIYRQALKANDYETALENWKIAYQLAPAADGKRDYHYTDGVAIYKHLLGQTQDEAKKQEYKDGIVLFYDKAIECYKNGAITTKNSTEEEKKARIGYLYGRKAYDMFYFVNSSYDDNIEALNKCIKYSGDDAEYTILDIYPRIIVWEYQNGGMTKEKAAELYKRLNTIAEYNIANNEVYAEGYQQAQAAMEGIFSPIENEIFDCEYFKEKLVPEYRDNPEDAATLKRILVTLKAQGCADNDPIIMELDEAWKKYATEENARIQAEFEANNPAAAARVAYDAGRYQEAISKYREALREESDATKKATYLFGIASIEFRKLNQYSQARSTAYEAAKMNPGWGRPYMLIGDMYAKTARSCGDSWNQRLAILAAVDKYAHARSIDSSVSGEASQRIGAYSGSYPEKQEGFMRGVSEGQSATVGCWIGETVKLRFK
jgi:tetratricopeptide (TPR) repeat protein